MGRGNEATRHEATRHRPEVVRKLIGGYDYQLKFVIDSRADLAEVDGWLGERLDAQVPLVEQERLEHRT